jgi:uncharacterized protein YxeA
MKKEIKIIIAIILILIVGFLINSRRVKQKNYDFIVLMELYDVFEKCNSRLESNLYNNKRLDYNDSLYNYYIDSKGIEICLCKQDSIKKIIEQNVKQNFNENWKFIY